ncbi:MAG: hypothetical protein K2N05_00210 [Muribaculaceae bacterium]|nr:hypothetical protein [Muribaculaceae bacterium]
MRDFHIFNPETDLVLAGNSLTFTPKKGIELLRTHLALLPSIYAEEWDVVIVPDECENHISSLPFYYIAKHKNIEIIPLSQVSGKIMSEESMGNNIGIKPWGWNKEIISRLTIHNVDMSLLPSFEYVDSIRNLSHRKMTTAFFSHYKDFFPNCNSPLFLSSITELEDFIIANPSFCLKAPWSSSGRGIVFSDKMPMEKIMEWGLSVIDKQGGVMAEKKYSRSLDFASEWYIDNGSVSFAGLSLFESSPRGKYKGNYIFSDDKIKTILKSKCRWKDDILNYQKEFLSDSIAPIYCGPVGIDMLADQSGDVNPCVEINLRMTMGHIAINLERQAYQGNDQRLSELLKDLFPNYYFSPSILLNNKK